MVGKECNWVKFHLLCYLSCTGPSRANRTVRRPVGKPTAQVGLKIQGNSLKPVLCGKVACTYRCAKTRCLASLRKDNYRIYRAVRAVTVMTNNSRHKCVSCRAILIYCFLNKQTSDHKNPQVKLSSQVCLWVFLMQISGKDGLWSRCLCLLWGSLKQITELYVQKMALSWSNDVRGLATSSSTAVLIWKTPLQR